jgi:hypothetical protein
MPKKQKDLEVLEELISVAPTPEPIAENEESDGEMELKPQKKKIYNVKPKDPNTPKKERTPAQIEAWKKALAKRQANRETRMSEKETEKERIARELNEKKILAKKQVEDKIVKKAISIKKKAIKKEIILDEISDDETPIEEIKQIVRKQTATRQQPVRQVNTVVQTPVKPVPQLPRIVFM